MSEKVNTELDAVLIGMTGRRLTVGEIIAALELPSATYYQQRRDNRLISAENLVKAARNLGINELALLVRFKIVSPAAIDEYVELYGANPQTPKAKMRRRHRLFPDFVAPVEAEDL
jgi:hypothetical protein